MDRQHVMCRDLGVSAMGNQVLDNVWYRLTAGQTESRETFVVQPVNHSIFVMFN